MDQLDGFTLFRAASLDSIEGLPPRRIPLMDSVRDRVKSPPLPTFGRQSPTARNLQDTKMKPALPPSNLRKIDSRRGEDDHEDKKSITSMPIIVSADGDVLTDFIPIARPRQARVHPQSDEQTRVTLHYDGLRAPTLVLRFSALHMPSPGTMLASLKNATPTDTEPPTPIESVTVESTTVESVKKDVIKRRAISAYAQPIPNPFDDADTQSLRPLRLRRASTQVRKRADRSPVATVGFDPIADVRALANKFPSPPDDSVGHTEENVTLKTEQWSQSGHDEGGRSPGLDRSSSGNSKQSSRRSNSTRRKPPPMVSPALVAQSVTSPTPLPTRPPPIPRTSIEDQRTAQSRQRSRMNWTPNDVPPSTGAALRTKNSYASNSISTARTMGTSMAPSTSPTGMSFRDAIDSVYDPEYAVAMSEDQPMGGRTLEMEAYLDLEKERRGVAPPNSDVATPRAVKDRQNWERTQDQIVTSPSVVARRRPQGNVNTEFPWAQKEDPVMGANVDLEAAWQTATTTARTHDEVGHAGGDHTVGQVKSMSRVTSRRQPVVRPVIHSVLSISVEEQEESVGDDISIGDQWSFVDPYASVVPAGMRGMSVPEEPDSPVDRWEPNPYIRP